MNRDLTGFGKKSGKTKTIKEKLNMKKCPFCAEEIQDGAIKCKHCGEFIKKMKKWYFQPIGMTILFFAVGPFALPLVWLNPDLNKKIKIIITSIIIVLFYFLTILAASSFKKIITYYDTIFNML